MTIQYCSFGYDVAKLSSLLDFYLKRNKVLETVVRKSLERGQASGLVGPIVTQRKHENDEGKENVNYTKLDAY